MTEWVKARLAVVGVGVMGMFHVHDIATLENTELVALCDIDPEKAKIFGERYGVPTYLDYMEMLTKERLDGVVIATPHYDHTPMTIEAFRRGIHVLTEKPIAVHVKDARKMIAAYEEAKKTTPNLIFAIMFMQRTYGFWKKIKEMIDAGMLGKLVRASWIITDWYRSQSYYNSGGWRATWRGEGGGVLLNQCPHNLDILQWLVGLPKRVTGFVSVGKYHDIEVEDEVTGYFEYENGMVGHFITTTAESPGTNRLEIVGEMGKLIFEDGKLTFFRNKVSMFDFSRMSPSAWDKVEYTVEEVPFTHHGLPGHGLIIENFANGILKGESIIVPGEEGIRSLMMSNGMVYSSYLGKAVELPFDEDGYETWLMERISTSRYQKPEVVKPAGDPNKSYGFH